MLATLTVDSFKTYCLKQSKFGKPKMIGNPRGKPPIQTFKAIHLIFYTATWLQLLIYPILGHMISNGF